MLELRLEAVELVVVIMEEDIIINIQILLANGVLVEVEVSNLTNNLDGVQIIIWYFLKF